MNDHFDEGALQALLDGELDASMADDARRHVAGCEQCAERFEWLREGSDTVSSALRILDQKPALEPPRPAALVPPPSTRGRLYGRRGTISRTAAIALTFAAATAVAMPRSPVRAWFADRLSPVETVSVIETSTRDAASSVENEPRESGLSVDLPEAGLRIRISQPGADLSVRVQLTEDDRAWIYAVGDLATARFSTSASGVEVIGASGGELRLEIPARARSAQVEIDGRDMVTLVDGELRLLRSDEAGSGPEIVIGPR